MAKCLREIEELANELTVSAKKSEILQRIREGVKPYRRPPQYKLDPETQFPEPGSRKPEARQEDKKRGEVETAEDKKGGEVGIATNKTGGVPKKRKCPYKPPLHPQQAIQHEQPGPGQDVELESQVIPSAQPSPPKNVEWGRGRFCRTSFPRMVTWKLSAERPEPFQEGVVKATAALVTQAREETRSGHCNTESIDELHL